MEPLLPAIVPTGGAQDVFQQRLVGLTDAPLTWKHEMFTVSMEERQSLPTPLGIGI